MDKICINKLIILALLLIIILLAIYQYLTTEARIAEIKSSVINNNNNMCSNNLSEQTKTIIDIIKSQPENETVQIAPISQIAPIAPIVTQIANPIRDYDYRALADPLVPPYKRDDYMVPLPSIPSRGYPSSFKKMGTLIDQDAPNTDPYKFMILVGRQKYPGSNYYDYYVSENKTDGALKFDLPDIHKEFMTDDLLKVNELDKLYTIKIDRNLGFDYNPFIY
jgi:hypothetical protein